MSYEREADDVRAVAPGTAALLLIGGLGLCGSTLLGWTDSSGLDSSVWTSSSAGDVTIVALAGVATVVALVALVRGGCRAFLVAAASAAALTAACWAGEYVKLSGAGPWIYPGPAVALGCALALLTGAAICVRRASHVKLGRSRPVAFGRIALLAAGIATPALTLATGAGGESLYEGASVVDVGLVVLAVLALFAAVWLSRDRVMVWIAVVAGAGLAGLAYAVGLELLLVEQDVFTDTDGTGLVLAFVAAPLAAAGTILLAAALDEGAT